jgi:hypothetical protein
LRGQGHQRKSVLARMVAPFIGGGALPFFLDASDPARAPPWDVASIFGSVPLCAR